MSAARVAESRLPKAEAAEVAEHLGVPTATLAKWRSEGSGPRWRKVGRHVRYDWRSVDAWFENQPGGGSAA
jgi:hypothetical protein